MLGGGAPGASPSPPKTASSRAAGAGSDGGAAAAPSGVGVSSTRAKSFDAGVDITAGDTLARRGTMCEGTRGRGGGAGDGAGFAGGESGRKLAVQLVRVSFSSLPRKLSLFDPAIAGDAVAELLFRPQLVVERLVWVTRVLAAARTYNRCPKGWQRLAGCPIGSAAHRFVQLHASQARFTRQTDSAR